MESPLLNLRDLQFQLFEVLDACALTALQRYADHSRETFDAALDTAHAIAIDKFAPHNRQSDAKEPHFDGQCVTVIEEVREAVRSFADAGLIAAAHDYSLGGMQLPVLIAQACLSLFKSANVASASYVGLTISSANLIRRFGTQAQQDKYLGPLLSGRFLGTMALTEPQAGSRLAGIATSATPNPDGSYSICGNKIFISGGDHELSENIVHLVLAKIPGGPAGVKGLSLFIVPKYRVNADTSLGARNDVSLAGLIHKMGWRGTTSTMLSFGEAGACVGELVGQPHQGLAQMFHMMNEARIGVGMGAVMLGYRGYLASLAYARDRIQGSRALIGHADVRRMLLAQKAYVEGGYGLCLHAAWLVDQQRCAATDGDREEAGLLLDLLTPVVKSWPAQWCLEANSLAIQVHGGYRYTREYPVEQFYRDNRLNPIHEGTHGIQALDLLGRKIMQHDGAALTLLATRMRATIADAFGVEQLKPHASALAAALADVKLTVATVCVALEQDGELALANASAFLEAFGHVVVAWIWLRQAVVAAHASPGDEDFYQGKLLACRWFFRYELPRSAAQLALVRSMDDTTVSLDEAWF